MTAEDTIEKLRNGDLSVEDADKTNDLEGDSVEFVFRTEDGPVIVHFNYYNAHRPRDGSGTGLVEFDLF